MRKRDCLLCLTLLSLVTLAVAEPVTPKKAAIVAQNFWSSTTHAKSASNLVLCTDNWDYNGIYLFNNPDGGWVLVAADDAARPILGYSTTGTLTLSNMPNVLRDWLNGYQQQIEYLKEHKAKSSDAYTVDATEWQRLTKGETAKGSGAKSVQPLITSNWDQQYPYNMLCPGTTVTGCAATAQAQLMKFWNYPAFGNGSHSYTAYGYGVQSADFGNTLYDWENMPSQLLYGSDSLSIAAVSTLMYHCGVSLEMGYGTAAQGGSSALGLIGQPGFSSIDNSLQDYFFFSRNMSVIFKDYGYTNESWRNALIAEIDLGHPILYCGQSSYGGHAFICDGYDDQQYMHFNFGWSGVGDGYYTVDSISPGVGGVGGNVTYTFNLSNTALIGAVPDYGMRVSDTIVSFLGNGGSDSLLFCINETVNAPWSVTCDADWVTVDYDAFERAGWVRFIAGELTTDMERVATVVFTQGGERKNVKIVQVNYSEEEMCHLTVVMECTHGDGWQGGAHLSLESPNGYVFGTASLESGRSDTVSLPVAPKDVHIVWHSGGGTDRYINYRVLNQYGEEYVSVNNAYHNGGDHLIPWPCAHVGIEERPEATEPTVFPNPTSGVLNVKAERLQKIEVMDVCGRGVRVTTSPRVDIRDLPNGQYFIRITTSDSTKIKRIVKR